MFSPGTIDPIVALVPVLLASFLIGVAVLVGFAALALGEAGFPALSYEDN